MRIRTRPASRWALVGVAAAVAAAAAVSAGLAGVSGTRGDPSLRGVSKPVVVATAKTASFISAVSDTRRNRVYATWSISFSNNPDTRVYVAASTDGGRTFAKPVWLARDNGAGQSVVRVDGNGRVWATWTHYDLKHEDLLDPKQKYSNPSWQELAYSDDAGRTWSRPVDVPADHGLRHGSAFGALAVSPSGKKVSVFWIDYLPVFDPRVKPAGRDAGTYLAATSVDGGKSFGPVRKIVQTGCVCCEPFGLSLDGRTALLFRGWQKATVKHDLRDIKLTVAVPGGGWTAPVSVHDDHFLLHHCPSVGPAGAVDRAGLLHVAWWTGATGRAGYWYAIRGTDGTFGTPVEIEAHPSAPNENNATITLDGNGTVWTATVGHGDFAANGNVDTSPNQALVYTITGSGKPRLVKAATVDGSYPQLAAVPGAVVEVWANAGRLLARRLEVR